MKQITTYRIPSEDPHWHIPGVHNTQQTLCGFVDCRGLEESYYEDNPCDCDACIDALKKIQALKFPKGYFKP